MAPGNRIFSCGADGTLKMRVLPNAFNIPSDLCDIMQPRQTPPQKKAALAFPQESSKECFSTLGFPRKLAQHLIPVLRQQEEQGLHKHVRIVPSTAAALEGWHQSWFVEGSMPYVRVRFFQGMSGWPSQCSSLNCHVLFPPLNHVRFPSGYERGDKDFRASAIFKSVIFFF